MHVVVIGYVWPEPQSSAAGQNMLNLLHCLLRAGWRVSFLSASKPTGHEFPLADIGVDCHAIEINCDSVNQLLTALNPDIVIFDRYMIEEQFGSRVIDSAPNALRILNTEDLHALREARQKLAKRQQQNKSNELQGLDPQHVSLQSELFYREVAAILRCDMTLLVSKSEKSLLVERLNIPESLLYFWPLRSGIDAHADNMLSYDERQHFVFIGNFRHLPNWDSVLWMRQAIWPLIREQIPNAQIHIYGAYTPEKAVQLHAPKLGFHISGWAKDAQTVLQQARICLAPLRFGAGVKGKFLDAIQVGTPSVTTPLGTEGITDKPDWPGALGDTAEQIANTACELYLNESAWQHAQDKCLALQHPTTSAESDNHFIQACKDAIEHLEQRREDNFFGAMLRHHAHASTRYMTQWIAAKNNKQHDT